MTVKIAVRALLLAPGPVDIEVDWLHGQHP
jgi:hypothetical protein